MILMQRLVVSSIAAIRMTLERRLDALSEPEGQMSLFQMFTREDWEDMDGQEQMESALVSRLSALKNEYSEVKLLFEAARNCEQTCADAKAEVLLEWIYQLQQEENDTELKILVFTEFLPTQGMLKQFLEARGFSVVCLNGSLNMDERRCVQDSFVLLCLVFPQGVLPGICKEITVSFLVLVSTLLRYKTVICHKI